MTDSSLSRLVALASSAHAGTGIAGITDSYWAVRNGKKVKISQYKTPNAADYDIATLQGAQALPVGSTLKGKGKFEGVSFVKIDAETFEMTTAAGTKTKVSLKAVVTTAKTGVIDVSSLPKVPASGAKGESKDSDEPKASEPSATKAAATPSDAKSSATGSKTGPVTIGDQSFTRAQVAEAVQILESAKGIMVKQPLAAKGNALAGTAYKALAKEFDSSTTTKPAFIAMLKAKLGDPDATSGATQGESKPQAKSGVSPASKPVSKPVSKPLAPVTGDKAPGPSSGSVEIGGQNFTTAQVTEAISILESAKGIMVKQPLAAKGNPLAQTEYKALAKAHDPSTTTKPAFIAMLKSKVGASNVGDKSSEGATTASTPSPATSSGVASVTIGGTPYSAADVASAISILESAKGIMVKQPLVAKGNPLAGTDYKALAKAHDPSTTTKPGFVALLKAKLDKAAPASPAAGTKVESQSQVDALAPGTQLESTTAVAVKGSDGTWSITAKSTGAALLPGASGAEMVALVSAGEFSVAKPQGSGGQGESKPGTKSTKPVPDLETFEALPVGAVLTFQNGKKLKKTGADEFVDQETYAKVSGGSIYYSNITDVADPVSPRSQGWTSSLAKETSEAPSPSGQGVGSSGAQGPAQGSGQAAKPGGTAFFTVHPDGSGTYTTGEGSSKKITESAVAANYQAGMTELVAKPMVTTVLPVTIAQVKALPVGTIAKAKAGQEVTKVGPDAWSIPGVSKTFPSSKMKTSNLAEVKIPFVDPHAPGSGDSDKAGLEAEVLGISKESDAASAPSASSVPGSPTTITDVAGLDAQSLGTKVITQSGLEYVKNGSGWYEAVTDYTYPAKTMSVSASEPLTVVGSPSGESSSGDKPSAPPLVSPADFDALPAGTTLAFDGGPSSASPSGSAAQGKSFKTFTKNGDGSWTVYGAAPSGALSIVSGADAGAMAELASASTKALGVHDPEPVVGGLELSDLEALKPGAKVTSVATGMVYAKGFAGWYPAGTDGNKIDTDHLASTHDFVDVFGAGQIVKGVGVSPDGSAKSDLVATYSQLNALPSGSVVSTASGINWAKSTEGKWVSPVGTTKSATQLWDSGFSGLQIESTGPTVSAPTSPAASAPKASSPPAPGAKLANQGQLEDLSPGSLIKDSDGDVWLKKDNGKWGIASHTSQADAFGGTSSSYVWEDYGSQGFTLVSSPDSSGDQAAPVLVTDVEMLQTAQEGAQVTAYSGVVWTKGPDETWATANGNKVSSATLLDVYEVGDITLTSFGNGGSPVLDEGTPADSVDALVDAAIGTVVKTGTGITLTKSASGLWKNAGGSIHTSASLFEAFVSISVLPPSASSPETPAATGDLAPVSTSFAVGNLPVAKPTLDLSGISKDAVEFGVIGDNTTYLNTAIKEIIGASGFKSAGLGTYVSGAGKEVKTAWARAVLKGDLARAYEIETALATSKHKKEGHPKAATHPGTKPGASQVTVAPAVVGELTRFEELPASVREEAGYLQSGYHYSYSIPSEIVDKILAGARMANAEGLTEMGRAKWALAFVKGDRALVDALSRQAAERVANGELVSKPLVIAPAKVAPGQSVEIDPAWPPFNAKVNQATNLSAGQVDAYLSQVFSTTARYKVLAQPLEVRRALAQLHWLSAQPGAVKGAHATPAAAKAEFADYSEAIEAQVASAGWTDLKSASWALKLPSFGPKTTVYTKDPDQPKLAGFGTKFFVRDDEGRRWLFKVAPEPFRADVENAAHDAARFFGFKAADSRVVEVDGVVGQVQGLLDPTEIRGTAPEDLTDAQLADVLREHVFDWVTGNDDAHDQNFLVQGDGSVVGIDKGRAWGPGFGKYQLKRGQLSSQSKVYYEDVYAAIVSGKIDPERAVKAYRSVMSRARQVSKRSDEGYRAILDQAFGGPSYPRKGAALASFKDQAVARKNAAFDDFEEFWTSILAEAGVDKPEPSAQVAPGIHAGATQEFMEDVARAGILGHPTFYASRDLEDAHLIVQSVTDAQGKAKVQGQGQLLASGNAKFEAWLKANLTPGLDLSGGAKPKPPAYQEFASQSSLLHSKILAGVKTISHHAKDGEYNQDKVQGLKDALAQVQGLQASLQAGKLSEVSPSLANNPELVPDWVTMADTYVKAAQDALEAMEGGLPAPGGFVQVNATATPPLVEVESSAPAIQVGKRLAKARSGSVGIDNQLLVAGESEVGHTGIEYHLTLPSGVEVTYRPHSNGVQLSQQGQIRFSSVESGKPGDPSVVQEVEDLLRTAGVELDPATEEDHEAFYWRHLWGVFGERSDTKPGGSSAKANAVRARWESERPDKASSLAEEIAAWRSIWATWASADQVESFVASQGYLPRLDASVTKDGQGEPSGDRAGRPTWVRFDVDLAKLRAKHPPLTHSTSNDLMALTGGIHATEERLRVLGKFVQGMSSSSDQGAGSAGYVFTRQNQGSSNAQVWLDPALAATTSAYAYDGDYYGKLAYRASYASFDIDKATSTTNSSNELMLKHSVSFQDWLLLQVVSESSRSKILEHYAKIGVTHIRGVPVAEVFVTSDKAQDAKAAVKKRLKEGWYDQH